MFKEAVEIDCCFAKALKGSNPVALYSLLKMATNAYKNAIAAHDNARDAIINLAFIEWLCTDTGTFCFLNLKTEELAVFEKDAFALLDKGIIQFPDDPEPVFWKRFFRWISYGTTFSESEGENLLATYQELGLPTILMLVPQQR